MKISIVTGESEGPTLLNAFDNALYEAGIGDVNLIKVSSMLEENTSLIPLPKLKAGKIVNCVLSSICSENKGDEITACVAVAIGDELGCVIEKTSINTPEEEVQKEAEKMVKYMMNKRNVKIKDLIIESITHKVEFKGSAIASVVYIKEDIVK